MKFPSKQYLCCPKITFKVEADEIEPVSLYCIVPIDKKIRQWKNVTYKIEWFVNGKKANYTEKQFCLQPSSQNESISSCQGGKEIRSLLPGDPDNTYYKPGQWVSCHCVVLLNHPKGLLSPVCVGNDKMNNEQRNEVLEKLHRNDTIYVMIDDESWYENLFSIQSRFNKDSSTLIRFQNGTESACAACSRGYYHLCVGAEWSVIVFNRFIMQ